MSSSLEREREVQSWNLQPGDFVQLKSEFCDVWHEVETVWDTACMIYVHRSPRPGRWTATEYTFAHDFRRFRRGDEPWRCGEARIVMDASGRYGDRNSPPLPEKYR